MQYLGVNPKIIHSSNTKQVERVEFLYLLCYNIYIMCAHTHRDTHKEKEAMHLREGGEEGKDGMLSVPPQKTQPVAEYTCTICPPTTRGTGMEWFLPLAEPISLLFGIHKFKTQSLTLIYIIWLST